MERIYIIKIDSPLKSIRDQQDSKIRTRGFQATENSISLHAGAIIVPAFGANQSVI